MTHADVFLQDILERPDDDAPRLIFADWLEEQGDAARAEFIRVQCALAAAATPTAAASELRSLQARLLRRHEDEWARAVRGRVRDWAFRRGFIDEVHATIEQFLRRAEHLFRSAPIQHVELHREGGSRSSASLASLADCPRLSRLRSLNLSKNDLDSDEVAALSVCPHLKSLSTLNLSGNAIGDAGLRALLAAPFFPQLTCLNLRRNYLSIAGVRALTSTLQELADSPNGLRLARLELDRHRLVGEGWRAIAAMPLVRRVVRW